MKELIIEFGNDTLGEARIYQRNPKGYEQAIYDMKLYKAQQKAEIDYLKAKITAECKEHQETTQMAYKTIRLLEKALEIAVNIVNLKSAHLWTIEEIKTKAEEMMKSE